MADLVSHDILVPTDFRPGSRAALERAVRSLGPEGGTICVLHVIDQTLLGQVQALLPEVTETELQQRFRQQAEAQYAALVADLDCGSATVEPFIISGKPFVKIVQLARDLDVDMIVMTVHRGATHVEQFLFGSTAERVLRLAPCPVLIVPETPAAQADNHVAEG
ncbi:MAG: universal stress protein [Candidatus Tectimicrobiota bacterium]